MTGRGIYFVPSECNYWTVAGIKYFVRILIGASSSATLSSSTSSSHATLSSSFTNSFLYTSSFFSLLLRSAPPPLFSIFISLPHRSLLFFPSLHLYHPSPPCVVLIFFFFFFFPLHLLGLLFLPPINLPRSLPYTHSPHPFHPPHLNSWPLLLSSSFNPPHSPISLPPTYYSLQSSSA